MYEDSLVYMYGTVLCMGIVGWTCMTLFDVWRQLCIHVWHCLMYEDSCVYMYEDSCVYMYDTDLCMETVESTCITLFYVWGGMTLFNVWGQLSEHVWHCVMYVDS